MKATFHSPLGLFDFQAQAVARGCADTALCYAFDCGIGKTIVSIASACLLFDQDVIDMVVVIAEGNKIREWCEDFPKFSNLVPEKYHGATREKALTRDFNVLVTTYETFRIGAAPVVKGKGGKKSIEEGPLLHWLMGKRILFIYDEISKLRNRGSWLYKSHDFVLKRLRKKATVVCYGLTATPMETTPENAFNILRLLKPDAMPTIKDFEAYYTYGRDPFDRLQFRKNRLPEFYKNITGPLILRKRKTDADVIDQFPQQMEESRHLPLLGAQKAFYETVESMAVSLPDDQATSLWTVLRQIAGHPEALLYSQGVLASNIVDIVGAEGLKRIPSTKTLALIEELEVLVRGQGAKALIFSYYGQSVVPLVARDLRAAGITVYQHHPPMSLNQREEAKIMFKESTTPCVLLSSDAGQKGMNVPEADYVFNYELPTTYSAYQQRISRNHRIDSAKRLVTAISYIAKGTVEEDIAVGVMDRQHFQDEILGDQSAENYLLAETRRNQLAIAKWKTGLKS